MATLRPTLAAAFPLTAHLRGRIATPADPALPGLAPPPRPGRRSSAGQLGLVAVPTLAVLVGSALAVGNASQQASAPPPTAPSRVAGVPPAGSGVGPFAARPGLLVPRPAARPLVLDRSAGRDLGLLAWTARTPAAPRTAVAPAQLTVLAGRRAALPAGDPAPASGATGTPARAGRHHRHRWTGDWRPVVAADPPAAAAPAPPVATAAPTAVPVTLTAPVGVSTGDPPAVTTGVPPTDPGLGKGTGPVDTTPVEVAPVGVVSDPIVVSPGPGATVPPASAAITVT